MLPGVVLHITYFFLDHVIMYVPSSRHLLQAQTETVCYYIFLPLDVFRKGLPAKKKKITDFLLCPPITPPSCCLLPAAISVNARWREGTHTLLNMLNPGGRHLPRVESHFIASLVREHLAQRPSFKCASFPSRVGSYRGPMCE